MANIVQNTAQVWQRATLTQRIMLLGIALACIAAIVLLSGYASKPTFSLLYSGLATEEAAKIVQKIEDAGVAYELKDGGTTIYVPKEKVHSLRLSMAAKGLPSGENPGYEILKDQPLGAGPIRQRTDIRRALEGELARSISLIDAVVSARVHIVEQEVSVFRGRREKGASASVVLRLRPGAALSPTNVAAIVHMVAGGVQGLRHEDVVVVDSRGNLLSNEQGNSLATHAGTLHDYKARVEADMARKAEDMLAAVLGPNCYIVRVNGQLKMKTTSTVSSKLSRDNRAVVREETSETESRSVESGGGSNANPGGQTTDETTDSEVEYAHGMTKEEVTELPGEFESWSVAVFVDLGAGKGDQQGAEGGAAPPSISLDQVQDVVSGALGLQEQRDTIKVVETSFYEPEPLEAGPEDGGRQMQFYLDLARKLSLGILVVGALLALWILKGKSKGVAADAQAALEAQGGEGPGALPGGTQADRQLARSRLAGVLQQNPEQVKQLFHSWVQEENREG